MKTTLIHSLCPFASPRLLPAALGSTQEVLDGGLCVCVHPLTPKSRGKQQLLCPVPDIRRTFPFWLIRLEMLESSSLLGAGPFSCSTAGSGR